MATLDGPDLYEWWKSVGDKLKDSITDSLESSVQEQVNAMYSSIAREVNEGVKGEWYTRLVKLVGKEKADKIYAEIDSSIKSAATPYAIGAGAILAGGLALAFFLGTRKKR